MVLLNGKFDHFDNHLLPEVWDKAEVRVLADGGCNRIYSYYTEERLPKLKHKPDVIVGDLDSARPEVIEFFRARGTQVIKEEDQDTTDMMKATEYVNKCCKGGNLDVDMIIFYGAFGGRFDQELGNINTLYQYADRIPVSRLVLLSYGNFAELLLPGATHRILCNQVFERVGVHCGLLPIRQPCKNVTTSGLKWNLDHGELEFGALVSSCNLINSRTVTITTDAPLVWTTSFAEKVHDWPGLDANV